HRTRDWLKIKCMQRQEFVIGGYTEGSGSRQGFGALLLGTCEAGELHYNGRVGTGFNTRTLIELSRRLDGLKQAKPAFVDPPKGSMAKGVHWVKPQLVAEIEFHNWTRDGSLRHPSFRGLRDDKAAGEVTREIAVDARSVTPYSVSQRNDIKASSRAARIVSASAAVTLSHPDKLLFAGGGTKEDLAAYYRHIERWVLPHVIERPLALVRCPGGTDKNCFFQKHIHDALPDSIHTVDVSLPGAEEPPYLWIDSIEGLIALVQIDVLEIHTWGSQVKNLNRPDRIIFDLDPDPGVVWERIAEAALLIRNRLDDLGLISFVKVTGGKGLHIVVPIKPELGWDEVKNFSKRLAQEFTDRNPSGFTASLSKARRTDKIFIDYLRNGRGATAVAAYSTRAKASATVSVPVGWEELVIDQIKPDQFTLFNLSGRLQSLANDPWQDYNQTGQSLKNAIKSLRKTR
ncbi:MAG: DNA ligase D, partial [Burkholderiales bacterium]